MRPPFLLEEASVFLLSESHFGLEFYGTPGLRVTPEICGKDAKVQIDAWVMNPKPGQTLRYSICAACGCEVTSAEILRTEPAADFHMAVANLEIPDVHLWRSAVIRIPKRIDDLLEISILCNS